MLIQDDPVSSMNSHPETTNPINFCSQNINPVGPISQNTVNHGNPDHDRIYISVCGNPI